MPSDTRTITAGCICGIANHKVTLKSSDFPLKGYMCHCDSCRHMTGAMCLTVVFLPAYYTPSEHLLAKLTPYKFSDRITQYFCSTCGCHMLARCAANGDEPDSDVIWDIATGTMDRTQGIVDWQGHEHIQDTLDGGFADFLLNVGGKKMDRWPASFGKHEQLQPYWTARNSKAEATHKLHCQCKCGGVEFWVNRPTKKSAFAQKYWPDVPPDDVLNIDTPSEDEAYFLRDSGKKYLAGLCACDSCRLASGIEFTTWAFVPTVDITTDERGNEPWREDFGTLKKYCSSQTRGVNCYRYFCSTCGATVFYDAEDRLWLKDIAVGLLRAPEGARAETLLGWRTSRLGYRDYMIPRAESYALGIEKGLREWEGQREGEDLSGGSQSGGAL